MPIITISRGSYSRGKEVAEKVAEKLGYECISRDVLLDTLKEFNIPEMKLVRAIHDAPSILDRFTFGKERYIAYFQAILLEYFQKDKVVYHGLAGHFFVKNVPHVLKVRIIAEMEDRVKLEMQREGISETEARYTLRSDDEARQKWSLHLYGIDTNDSSLYDLVVHIKKITADDAADIICHAARLGHFQATPESQQAIDDLLLGARVRASLIEDHPRVKVRADRGIVHVGLEGAASREEKGIQDAAAQVPGVKNVEVHFYPFITPD
jgi:cytidylate kinase